MSRVPPPKSKTTHYFDSLGALSSPYAIAAAVGSLMIRLQTKPAISHASIVAYFYKSLKYAGTVTTAFFTS